MLRRRSLHEASSVNACAHEGAATVLARMLIGAGAVAYARSPNACALPKGSTMLCAQEGEGIWFWSDAPSPPRRAIAKRLLELPLDEPRLVRAVALRQPARHEAIEYQVAFPGGETAACRMRLGGNLQGLEKLCEAAPERMMTLCMARGSVQVELEALEFPLRRGALLQVAPAHLRAVLRTKQRYFAIQVREKDLLVEGEAMSTESMSTESMSAESLQSACTLSLGEVELPLLSLLKLRAGDVIEFERPETLTGMLDYEGIPCAKVAVSFDAQGLRLEILEVLSGIGLNGQVLASKALTPS